MKTDKIDRTRWKPYFRSLTGQLEGKRALIEVASLALGDQVEAEWLTLLGVSYEPESDHIDIAMQGVNHRVENPRDVFVLWGHHGLEAMEIAQEDGTQQILRLREPVALPPT